MKRQLRPTVLLATAGVAALGIAACSGGIPGIPAGTQQTVTALQTQAPAALTAVASVAPGALTAVASAAPGALTAVASAGPGVQTQVAGAAATANAALTATATRR